MVNGKKTKMKEVGGYLGSALEPRQWSFWERRVNQE